MLDINEFLKEHLESIDLPQLVRWEIRTEISGEIKRQIQSIVKKEIENIVETEIDIVMSKGIKTDDGWGKIEEYKSFEDLFKRTFSNKLNNDWEMKKVIEKHVSDNVKKLFQENLKTVVSKISSELDKIILENKKN